MAHREHTLQLAARGLFECGVDVLGGRGLAKLHGQVNNRDVEDRDAERDSRELPRQLRHHLGDRFVGARRGGDDVVRRGPRPPQVLVRQVLKLLVRRVGVDRGHHASLDAE